MKKLCSKTLKTLINELKDQCICEKLLEKNYLYYSKASNTENGEIFHGLHNKVALLMRRLSERETRNRHQKNFEKVWTIPCIYISI